MAARQRRRAGTGPEGASRRETSEPSPWGATPGADSGRRAAEPLSVVGTRPHFVGRVVHVHPRAGAVVVALSGALRRGDAVALRGATTDLCLRVERLERDGEPVESAAAGEQIGLALASRARVGDRVFRLLP